MSLRILAIVGVFSKGHIMLSSEQIDSDGSGDDEDHTTPSVMIGAFALPVDLPLCLQTRTGRVAGTWGVRWRE